MRYRLRTLLIFLATGPPLLAGAWWLCTHTVLMWAFAIALVVFIPDLMLALFGYGFGGLLHLIGRLPGGNDRKDTKF